MTEPKPPFVLLESDKPFLDKIPPRLVEPLQLAHAGNSYRRIADKMLMIPIGTVRSRISRARERILAMRAEAKGATNVGI